MGAPTIGQETGVDAALSVAEFVLACREIVNDRQGSSTFGTTAHDLVLDEALDLDSLNRLRLALVVETFLGRDLSDDELADANFSSLRTIFHLAAVDLSGVT